MMQETVDEAATASAAVAEPATRRALPSYPVIVISSLALAGLSLLVMPRGLAYDPWSWLVWGREIVHLHLNTRHAATSVKPLPMAFTAFYSLFGSAAPLLWLVTARAGALIAIGLAYRVGHRLGGVLAGVVAAVGVAASYEFAVYLFFTGMSEPMAMATALAAVDLWLSDRRRAMYVAVWLTAMLRIEAWPFALAIAVWLVWRDRRVGAAIGYGVSLLLLPAAWFGLDWVGSGKLLRSAGAAALQSQGGPLLTSHPGLATVEEIAHVMLLPVLVAAGLTVVAAIICRRAARPRLLLWVAAAAALWIAVSAGMAQARIATGAPRYLLPAAALASVVGGVGVAWLVEEIRRAARSSVWRWAAVTVVILAVAGASVPRALMLNHDVRGEIGAARLLDQDKTGLSAAVKLAGGPTAVRHCGYAVTDNLQVSVMAWVADLPFQDAGIAPRRTGTVFQLGHHQLIPPGLRGRYHRLGAVGPTDARWTVYSTCRR